MQTSVKSQFLEASKRFEPIRRAIQLEKDLLAQIIDRVAALDAEVKIRVRRGATYPSQLGHNVSKEGAIVKKQSWIQSQEDYTNDLQHRFLSDKEVKVNLMNEQLFEYLHSRLVNFEKYQASSVEFQVTENLFQSLMSAF